jgi:anti-anti-sigma regulatory factor
MKLSLLMENDWVVFKINGSIDSFTINIFEKELSVLLSSGKNKIIIDLTECSFINYKALKMLVRFSHQIYEKFKYGFKYKVIDEDVKELIQLISKENIEIETI